MTLEIDLLSVVRFITFMGVSLALYRFGVVAYREIASGCLTAWRYLLRYPDSLFTLGVWAYYFEKVVLEPGSPPVGDVDLILINLAYAGFWITWTIPRFNRRLHDPGHHRAPGTAARRSPPS